MQIDPKKYEEYLVMAKIVVNSYLPKYHLDDSHHMDILHDILIKFDTKKLNINEMSDSFVYCAIRNHHLDILKKMNKKINKADFESINDYIDYDEIDIDAELAKQDKMDKQSKAKDIVYDKMHSYDKQIFDLHFNQKWSQRKIGRKAGINYQVINLRINKMKNKIKEYEKTML
jgi:DNA-directed RNA polymerase specialized sigma24 family protein